MQQLHARRLLTVEAEAVVPPQSVGALQIKPATPTNLAGRGKIVADSDLPRMLDDEPPAEPPQSPSTPPQSPPQLQKQPSREPGGADDRRTTIRPSTGGPRLLTRSQSAMPAPPA
eukprot:20787-Prymnesium_polylepis.1